MNKLIGALSVATIVAGFTVGAYAQNTPQIIINVPGSQPAPAPQPQIDHHPEIHAAMEKIKHAKEDIDHASHDYGGHKEKAKRLLDAAQEELRQGVEYSEHHRDWH